MFGRMFDQHKLVSSFGNMEVEGNYSAKQGYMTDAQFHSHVLERVGLLFIMSLIASSVKTIQGWSCPKVLGI
jgi:hypothetical protein